MADAYGRRTVDAMIEIPRGSRNKYEWDHKRGAFRLDRVLYSSVHYPADYGFIPGTLAEDGDPLDILVLVQEPSFTGCLIEARPIGMLEMADDKGRDLKVLAVPAVDPRFAEIDDLAHTLLAIVEDVSIVSEQHYEIGREHEATVHQVRIAIGRDSLPDDPIVVETLTQQLVATAGRWAEACAAERHAEL